MTERRSYGCPRTQPIRPAQLPPAQEAQRPGWREDQRRFERRRRRFVAAAGPVDAKTPREALGVDVARPGERKDGAPLRQRDLRDEVPRRDP